MNNDTRLSAAIHILAALSLSGTDPQTSESLARSVKTNPVVVRRLLSRLKKSGLIDVQRGAGGSTLHRNPDNITLLDVHKAVVPNPKAAPFYLHQNPSSICYIGKNIHDALEAPFAKVNKAMQESLASTTLAEVAAFIKKRVSKGRMGNF
jgi:DNA-binding IscR family transcriptional regulator